MTHISRRASLALVSAGLILPATQAHAVYGERIYRDGQGFAIRGYDPVAFLENKTARKGKFDFEAEWQDAPWLFVSDKHREMFLDRPEKYAPQFGGYCAEAMARGFKRVSNPKLWVKVDSNIYLHYSVSEQNRWAGDIRGKIEMAEENWENLRDV